MQDTYIGSPSHTANLCKTQLQQQPVDAEVPGRHEANYTVNMCGYNDGSGCTITNLLSGEQVQLAPTPQIEGRAA